jgi:acetyltransferase-like isoleucine patch superfamily enzyme
MLLIRLARKGFWFLVRLAIVSLSFVDHRAYMRYYAWFLRRSGMRIHGQPRYISVKCWFDGSDLGLIELGHDVVISSNVRILTHDYSLTRAFLALGMTLQSEVANVRGVSIGENSFVGTGSIVMPGTRIGKNVIVAAGSVVRGDIPDDSMVMGNPAEVVGNTLEWGRSRLSLLENGKLRQDPSWWGRLEKEETAAPAAGAS